jgi:hypothetical protein
MKKLCVLAMIPAVAMLLAGSTTLAWDDHYYWGGIHGEYAMTATGSCVHSTLGFNDDFSPITGDGSVVWGATTFAQATWTFKRDGTGSVSGTNYVLDFPPGNPSYNGALAHYNPIVLTFKYELAHDGNITVTLLPSGVKFVGSVSNDQETMTLPSPFQFQQVPGSVALCNTARILIRVSDDYNR